MGVGIIDIKRHTPHLVFVDCILTSKNIPHEQRIHELSRKLKKLLKKYSPNRAAVEKLFFSQNVKTAMHVSEARGVILLALQEAGIPISEWTPQQIKQHVTGYGAADKKQVEKIVCAILKLKQAPKFDDATDALAVALTAQNKLTEAL